MTQSLWKFSGKVYWWDPSMTLIGHGRDEV